MHMHVHDYFVKLYHLFHIVSLSLGNSSDKTEGGDKEAYWYHISVVVVRFIRSLRTQTQQVHMKPYSLLRGESPCTCGGPGWRKRKSLHTVIASSLQAL